MVKLALIFFLLGAAWLFLAVEHRGWGWLYLWPGVSFLIVGSAYAGLGPPVLGKRADGTVAWWAVVLLLPYFLLAWVIWFAYAAAHGADAVTEVAPGLWVGRRIGARRLPPGTTLVVDMTSEFREPAALRRGPAGREYVCVPTLDYGEPDEATFRALVDRLAATEQPVYVHCAQGFGRAATVAAAVLIRRGLAGDVHEAEQLLKRVRPNVRISPGQKRLVTRVVGSRVPAGLSENGTEAPSVQG